MWQKNKLRQLFLLNKSFLHNLWKNDVSAKNILAGASIAQINLILKICHLIAIGEIPISSGTFQNLKKSKKASYFNTTFKTKKNIHFLLREDRTHKIDALV